MKIIVMISKLVSLHIYYILLQMNNVKFAALTHQNSIKLLVNETYLVFKVSLRAIIEL